MNISATIDKKITARYVFENTKYEIALICLLSLLVSVFSIKFFSSISSESIIEDGTFLF